MRDRKIMKKNFVKGSREHAETVLTRVNLLSKVKNNFAILKEDGSFKQLEKHSIQRRLEFNAATHFYLCDAAKYLCTHKKSSLNFGSLNYIEAKINWQIFLQITIGKYKNQYSKLMCELNNSQRHCYIPRSKHDGGGYFIMPPFRLDFTTIDQEKLSKEQQRKLHNINAQKIDTVTLSMAKPLFENFLKGGQYYQYPVNLYASIYHIISDRSEILQMSEKFIGKNFIAGYIRFIDYLYIHGAGNPQKNKISVNVNDLLSKVMPSLIYVDKQGRKHKYKRESIDFLIAASTLVSNYNLNCLDYKIEKNENGTMIKDDPNDSRKIIFNISHPKRLKK
jgi:hypothetical protein